MPARAAELRGTFEEGLALFADGRYPEAFDVVSAVAEEAPDEPRVWDALGAIALSGGMPGLAHQAFSARRNIAEDLGTVLNQVSAAYHAIDLVSARRHAHEAAERWPESAEARVWVDKLDAFEDEYAMLVDVGATLYREERYADALDVLMEAMKIADTPSARLWAGRTFLATGDAHSAAMLLQSVVAEYADDATVAIDLASAFAMGGRHDLALTYLREALRLNPGDPEIVEMLARLALDAGDYEMALMFAQGAAELRRGSASSWLVLAGAYEGVGRLGEARLAADRAIALDPGLTMAWGLGARLVERAGDKGLAARYRAASLRVAGGEADTSSAPPLGDLGREIEALYKWVSHDSAHVLAYRDRATIYRLLGEFERAIYYLDLVTRDVVAEPNPFLMTERGSLLAALGREADARIALGRALEIDPAFAPAQAALDELDSRSAEGAPAAFCPSCGTEFSTDSAYCTRCGTRRP